MLSVERVESSPALGVADMALVLCWNHKQNSLEPVVGTEEVLEFGETTPESSSVSCIYRGCAPRGMLSPKR